MSTDDKTEAIIRNLDLLLQVSQSNKQALSSLMLGVQAILETSPNKQEIVERYQALVQSHETSTGESIPRVLH